MKPVAIFRFAETEGPGYFATFLDRCQIPWQLFALDRGAALPPEAGAFAGLALMGGPMSVNDPLPWIEALCALVREADANDIPTIGHCLGGQLIAKAFGAQVRRNPVKEIGWGEVAAEDNDAARRWLGPLRAGIAFHWHGETFDLPDGAQPLLRSAACRRQMFARGRHLGMQCHVEMTEAMIRSWCEAWPDEVAGLARLPPSVQTPPAMLADAPRYLPALHALAERLYAVWIEGLRQ